MEAELLVGVELEIEIVGYVVEVEIREEVAGMPVVETGLSHRVD